jgi:N-acetylglucosaminyldiphosphoundecaprenol N-acetyl-beta-D-mannosaminyltransferase
VSSMTTLTTGQDRIDFLGCPVDRISTNDVLRWISTAKISGRRQRIVIVNANKYYLLFRDEELRRIVTTADLIIPEWAVVWGARQLHLPTLDHSGGLLIAQALLSYASESGLRLYFFGGREATLVTLIKRLNSEYPKLQIAGFHHGYVTSDAMEAAVISDIRNSRADVLLVGRGSPQQEKWIYSHSEELGVPVSIGVGGSFDVLSGERPDTPNWMRGKGLEWLFRAAQDPRAYARRYLVCNSWFIWQVYKEKFLRLTA